MTQTRRGQRLAMKPRQSLGASTREITSEPVMAICTAATEFKIAR